MVRKLFAIVLAMLLLTGCANLRQETNQLTQYNASFLTLFDTVTTIVGRYPSEKEFSEVTQAVHDELLEYHQLFDIYNDYEGLNNLKTVNDQAGIAPVEVDPRIIDLLTDCKAYYELTGGKVNVAMGSVLNQWHVARNASINDPANAYTPQRPPSIAPLTPSSLMRKLALSSSQTLISGWMWVRLQRAGLCSGWPKIPPPDCSSASAATSLPPDQKLTAAPPGWWVLPTLTEAITSTP